MALTHVEIAAAGSAADARTASTLAGMPARLGRAAMSLVIAVAVAVPLASAGLEAARERFETALPFLPRIPVHEQIVDDTPVPITVSAGWERVGHVTTPDAVVSDVTLWRRMRVEDWDSVPDPLRTRGIDAMLERHRALLTKPSVWDRMTAHDWDEVPHPVRALAFRHMLQYWTSYYRVGDRHRLPRPLVADTAAAVVMSESWFEHRAENVNRRGNRDMGLAQASDFARARMHGLLLDGRSDVVFEDEEYYNPWAATRFVAIWLSHLLDDLDGDLDLAVRAYHRGAPKARAGEGMDYLKGVLRRRYVYIRGHSDSPAWQHLLARDRAMTREAWPWVRARRVIGRERQRPATAAWDDPAHETPAWWRLAFVEPPSVGTIR